MHFDAPARATDALPGIQGVPRRLLGQLVTENVFK